MTFKVGDIVEPTADFVKLQRAVFPTHPTPLYGRVLSLHRTSWHPEFWRVTCQWYWQDTPDATFPLWLYSTQLQLSALSLMEVK